MEFIKDYTAKIVFGDGTQYFGYSFGAPLDTPHICEIVFNTSMVGYQEIVSDPSYTYQAVTLTYPIIGNNIAVHTVHIGKPLAHFADRDSAVRMHTHHSVRFNKR